MQVFRDLDRLTARHRVRDAQYQRIRGFPYARIDRFLASEIKPSPGQEAFNVWADKLRQADLASRRLELSNLPPQARPTEEQRLNECSKLLLAADLESDERRSELFSAARARPNYLRAHRFLGLYWLTAHPFRAGVNRLHEETYATFATPLNDLPVEGTLTRYAPTGAAGMPDDATLHRIQNAAAQDPFGMPDLSAADERTLLAAFAPVWEIDTVGAHDVPGRPSFSSEGLPTTTPAPITFSNVSYTRWQGKTQLQLNYGIWFNARPAAGRFDPLAGRLDGLIWRVTLGSDLRPLIFDAVHSCGCYHLFFPTERVQLRTRRVGFEEPIAAPQHLDSATRRPVIRIASATHYVQRVYPAEPGNSAPDRLYDIVPYDELRSFLDESNQRRSLFDHHGIVPGSQRGERWFFWPMGVRSAGAMRQMGTQAVAFVGQRHFDDPNLFERYFRPHASSELPAAAGSGYREPF